MISKLVLNIDRHLRGAPDELLTLALLTVAGALVIVAFCGDPALKAGALVWTVAP